MNPTKRNFVIGGVSLILALGTVIYFGVSRSSPSKEGTSSDPTRGKDVQVSEVAVPTVTPPVNADSSLPISEDSSVPKGKFQRIKSNPRVVERQALEGRLPDRATSGQGTNKAKVTIESTEPKLSKNNASTAQENLTFSFPNPIPLKDPQKVTEPSTLNQTINDASNSVLQQPVVSKTEETTQLSNNTSPDKVEQPPVTKPIHSPSKLEETPTTTHKPEEPPAPKPEEIPSPADTTTPTAIITPTVSPKPKKTLQPYTQEANDKALAYLQTIKKPEYSSRIPLLASLKKKLQFTDLDEPVLHEYDLLRRDVLSKPFQERAQQFYDAVKNKSTSLLAEYYEVKLEHSANEQNTIHILYIQEFQEVVEFIFQAAADNTLSVQHFIEAFEGLLILARAVLLNTSKAFYLLFENNTKYEKEMLDQLVGIFSRRISLEWLPRISVKMKEVECHKIKEEFHFNMTCKNIIRDVYCQFAPSICTNIMEKLDSTLDNFKSNLDCNK